MKKGGENVMIWKWSENLDSVIKHKKTGHCPFCNSENTDYVYQKFTADKGTFVVWCDNCNSLGFQMRLKIPKGVKVAEPEKFDKRFVIKN